MTTDTPGPLTDEELAGYEAALVPPKLIAAYRDLRAEVERLRAERHERRPYLYLGRKATRPCYECGDDVDPSDGVQHGRSGWVHCACILPDASETP